MPHLILKFTLSAVEAARRTGQSERTIRRETLRGKLKARKHGFTFQIALADLNHFVASHSPDVHTLLARFLTAEDLEDVQSSQATRRAGAPRLPASSVPSMLDGILFLAFPTK